MEADARRRHMSLSTCAAPRIRASSDVSTFTGQTDLLLLKRRVLENKVKQRADAARAKVVQFEGVFDKARAELLRVGLGRGIVDPYERSWQKTLERAYTANRKELSRALLQVFKSTMKVSVLEMWLEEDTPELAATIADSLAVAEEQPSGELDGLLRMKTLRLEDLDEADADDGDDDDGEKSIDLGLCDPAPPVDEAPEYMAILAFENDDESSDGGGGGFGSDEDDCDDATQKEQSTFAATTSGSSSCSASVSTSARDGTSRRPTAAEGATPVQRRSALMTEIAQYEDALAAEEAATQARSSVRAEQPPAASRTVKRVRLSLPTRVRPTSSPAEQKTTLRLKRTQKKHAASVRTQPRHSPSDPVLLGTCAGTAAGEGREPAAAAAAAAAAEAATATPASAMIHLPQVSFPLTAAEAAAADPTPPSLQSLQEVPASHRTMLVKESIAKYHGIAVWRMQCVRQMGAVRASVGKRRALVREMQTLLSRVQSRLTVGRSRVGIPTHHPPAPSDGSGDVPRVGDAVQVFADAETLRKRCVASRLHTSLIPRAPPPPLNGSLTSSGEGGAAAAASSPSSAAASAAAASAQRAAAPARRVLSDAAACVGRYGMVRGVVACDGAAHVEFSGRVMRWLPLEALVRQAPKKPPEAAQDETAGTPARQLAALIRERAVRVKRAYERPELRRRSLSDLPQPKNYVQGMTDGTLDAVTAFCAQQNRFFFQAVTEGGFAIRSPGRCLANLPQGLSGEELLEELQQFSYAQQVTMHLHASEGSRPGARQHHHCPTAPVLTAEPHVPRPPASSSRVPRAPRPAAATAVATAATVKGKVKAGRGAAWVLSRGAGPGLTGLKAPLALRERAGTAPKVGATVEERSGSGAEGGVAAAMVA